MFCCACLPLALLAQKATKAVKVANPQPYANSITADDLKKHLYIVAGKEMEGRGTGTAGERRAAGYIESQFKALGLMPGNKDSYQLYWPVFQDSTIRSSLEVNGKAYEMEKDFSVNANMAYSSTMSVSEAVFVGYGVSDSTRDDYKGVDVRGKFVIVLPGAPAAGATARRPAAFFIQEAAAKNGAAAVLLVQTNFPRTSGASALGQQYTNGFKKTIYPNTFTISEAVAEAIMGADYKTAKEAVKTGTAPARTYAANITIDFAKKTSKIQSSNVIGFVEGTDKRDEFVFITAHYDHLGKRDSIIYYGADDDGSGTVSVIELAEAFAKAKADGKGPRRSVVFMTVAGEERGLWGSAFYGDNPTFPLEKTTVDLNIDMIGRTDPERKGDSSNYVYVVGDDKLSTDLRPISEGMNKKYAKMELDYKFNDPNDRQQIYYRSDHYNFARNGVPIIFYFDGIHADYHKPTDTPDKINYTLMTKRARFVFHTAWEMANREDMLKRDLKLNMPGRN